jgi:hypothetical protein
MTKDLEIEEIYQYSLISFICVFVIKCAIFVHDLCQKWSEFRSKSSNFVV